MSIQVISSSFTLLFHWLALPYAVLADSGKARGPDPSEREEDDVVTCEVASGNEIMEHR